MSFHRGRQREHRHARGRMAVAEVIEMDREFERAILTNATEETIYKLARGKGMLTMKEDAILKAFNGEVPWSEVNKL